jgi:Metallopeptidase family M24
MNNLFIIIAFSGLVVNPFPLTNDYSATPALESPNSTTSSVKDNLSVTFTLRPVTNTNPSEMTEPKVAYAQKIAGELFKTVEDRKLIVAGKSEEQLNNEITQLAREKFGVETHWHKKIVRTGANTLSIYTDNPSDRIIQPDDILFLDFGIVVDGWESDYARTYVLGNDARKIKLKNDVEKAWYEIQAWYNKQTHVKASDLFALTRKKASEYGWTAAGDIAGHIVGKYPHEQPVNPKSLELDVHPDNPNDMFLLDANGNKRHWILEVHFIDKENNIGAYIEQLL